MDTIWYIVKVMPGKERSLTEDFNKQISQEKIKNIQEKKLKKILKLAVSSVPFYKELNLNIDFENFTIDELKKFPIIDKSIISSGVDKLANSSLSFDFREDHYTATRNSGDYIFSRRTKTFYR